MALTTLRYFHTAARLGNISRAAEELYISRQALSKAIKRLEEQVGAPLIRPGAQGFTLTAEGERLDRAAGQILAIWDEAVADARPGPAPLRLGYGHNTYNLWPADHIARYEARHPELALSHRSLPPDRLLAGLRAGELDLVLSNVRPLGQDLACRPLLPRPVCLLVHRQDPLAGRAAVRPGDLAGRRVLFIPHDQTGAAHFARLMEGYGLPYTPMVSSDSTITTIYNELLFHQAVFVTSGIFLHSGRNEEFCLVPFDTGLPRSFYSLDVNAVTRREDARRPEIEAYLAYLQGCVRPEFRPENN